MLKALWIVAAAPLLLAVGCCSTFEDDWGSSPTSEPTGLPGCWDGTWRSDGGHEGALRCIVTAKEGGAFEARYHATYDWCIFGFSFEYAVPVTVERDGRAWKFRGSAELGCWIGGGLYEYEGRVEGADYTATYTSDGDRGVFKMKRAK